MINITRDNYEKKIPPRSTLYNLEPKGLGTPYVESLTSYISRLAECHSLNVSTLICSTFIPYVKTYLKESFQKGSLGPKIKYINGNSPISVDYIRALEHLTTRTDLVYLTMNSWTGLFSNNVIGDSRKWCPTCLEEAKNNGNEIYERLIWYIKDNQMCDKHQVKLEDSCLKCGKQLNFLHPNFIVGHCQYCLSWLGYVSENEVNHDLEYQTFIINSFKALLANGPNSDVLPTNLKIGFVFKKMIEHNNLHTIKELAKYLGFHQAHIRGWIDSNNTRKPSIESYFKICSKTNLSIYSLFGSAQEVDYTLQNAESKNFNRRAFSLNEIEKELKGELINNNYESLNKLCSAKGFGIRRAKKHYPILCEKITHKNLELKNEKEQKIYGEIKQKLLLSLQQETPISLQQFSKIYNISTVKLKKYCPNLTTRLIERNKIYKDRLAKERYERNEKEIKETIRDLHYQGKYPGSQTVRKNLSNPNCFMEPRFRDIWKNELKLLGYK